MNDVQVTQVQFNTEIPADLHRLLRLRAVKTGQTVKDLTQQLLAEGLVRSSGSEEYMQTESCKAVLEEISESLKVIAGCMLAHTPEDEGEEPPQTKGIQTLSDGVVTSGYQPRQCSLGAKPPGDE